MLTGLRNILNGANAAFYDRFRVAQNDGLEPTSTLALLHKFVTAESMRDLIGTKPEFHNFQGMFCDHAFAFGVNHGRLKRAYLPRRNGFGP
jgi:hypothetical protein